MVKKIIFILPVFILILMLINAWPILALQKNVKQYLSLNINKSEDEQLIEKSAKKIIKNYKNINKNLKKIIFKDFNEDLNIILPHFLSEKNNSYLIILQNSDELRATGGFMGSYFFLEFSHGILNLTPVQDIYTVAGQQKSFPPSPKGHYEYLSEGKGLLIQDANWWADVPTSAQKIISMWQKIALESPYFTQDKEIAGIILVNLNLVENLLGLIGPIQLPDYEKTINSENFAEIAREDRLDFFAGSKEKANFLNHSKIAIENQLAQLNAQEQLAFIKFLIDNFQDKNIQIYSQKKELQAIWQKHNFAGQVIKKNPNSFYFYSVESNVGINKANRLINREFYFYQNDEQIQQIKIEFSNHNRKPLTINSNPELNVADHLAYINYQRLYFSPETSIKKIQLMNEDQNNKMIDFASQPYFNQDDQEFLEVSFLVAIPEQKQIEILIDLETDNQQNVLEIQKQSGIKQIPIHLYQNQKLINNWILTRDQLE